MTPTLAALDPLVRWMTMRLFEGSLQAILVVGLVWMLCRRFTSISAELRTRLWWLVALKLVVVLLPLPHIPLPLLPATSQHPETSGPPRVAAPRHPTIRDVQASVVTPAAVRVSIASRAGTGWPWAVMSRWTFVAVWLLAVCVSALTLARSLARTRAVIARARPAAAPLQHRAAAVAARVGLTRVPPVRVSHDVETPQVVGVRCPQILLPEAVETFVEQDQVMTLCHELLHVQRRDLMAGWIPALAERLFFFHPLARLASREYLLAREAACDAAVLRTLDVAPQAYGRLVVRFGVLRDTPLAATAASSSSSTLRRRLEMLHDTVTRSTGRRRHVLLLAAAAMMIVPFHLSARVSDAPGSPFQARRASAEVPQASLEPGRHAERSSVPLRGHIGPREPAPAADQSQNTAQAIRPDELKAELPALQNRRQEMAATQQAIAIRPAANAQAAQSPRTQVEQLQAEKDGLMRRVFEMAAARQERTERPRATAEFDRLVEVASNDQTIPMSDLDRVLERIRTEASLADPRTQILMLRDMAWAYDMLNQMNRDLESRYLPAHPSRRAVESRRTELMRTLERLMAAPAETAARQRGDRLSGDVGSPAALEIETLAQAEKALLARSEELETQMEQLAVMQQQVAAQARRLGEEIARKLHDVYTQKADPTAK